MKKWTGKVMATTVAAAVLLSGMGGLGSHQVYADDDDSDVVVQAPNTSIPLSQRVNLELNTIVFKASSLLDMDFNELNDQLKSGKSLKDIAQSSEHNDVLNQLITMLNQNVDIALNQNAITSGEAAALKTKVQEEVNKAFEKAGYQDTNQTIEPVQEPSVQLNLNDTTGALADLIGVSKEQLETAVELEGKSIADIAAAKGISDDQLIAKLKDELTSALRDFIQQK